MQPRVVLLLDFASEMNRGDAAMQDALIEMTRRYLPGYARKVVCVYGANQRPAFPAHFDASIRAGAEILPGLRPTYNPLDSASKDVRAKKLRNLLNMGFSYAALLAFAVTGGRLALVPGASDALAAIRGADVVIWNGRNFRDRKGIGEIYDLLAMLLHPLFCFALGKRVYALGVSIWPLHYRISRGLLKFALGRCEYVTARERNSLDYATGTLGLRNVRLLPDLSYNFLRRIDGQRPNRDPKRVSLTLVDWTEDGPEVLLRYVASMRRVVNELVARGFEIDVVPQVYYEWESYRDLLDEVLRDVRSNPAVRVIERNMTAEDLADQYARSALLVATRMHSAIFALTRRTRVLAIPYDAGGKWAILTDLGMDPAYMESYQTVTPERIVRMLDDVLDDDRYFEAIDERLPDAYARVDENVSRIPACNVDDASAPVLGVRAG